MTELDRLLRGLREYFGDEISRYMYECPKCKLFWAKKTYKKDSTYLNKPGVAPAGVELWHFVCRNCQYEWCKEIKEGDSD